MSKIITSPVKRFPGTVTLADPLTFPQVLAWEDALAAAQEMERPTVARLHYALLPAVFQVVEAWNLEGLPANVTPDTFPATPKTASAQLISWLINEVTALHQESEEVPLAS